MYIYLENLSVVSSHTQLQSPLHYITFSTQVIGHKNGISRPSIMDAFPYVLRRSPWMRHLWFTCCLGLGAGCTTGIVTPIALTVCQMSISKRKLGTCFEFTTHRELSIKWKGLMPKHSIKYTTDYWSNAIAPSSS